MKIHIVILAFFTVFTVFFTNPPMNLAQNKKIHFEDVVVRGQSYQKSINKILNFKLIPTEYGWEISVENKIDSGNNYCEIATPPFHGINAIYIDGWHFRNSDNSANNEAGEQSVAPQENRGFAFVISKKDYNYVSKLLDKILYPQNISEKEQEDATDEFFAYKKATGLLHIKKLKLGNLIVEKQAWIEKMEFSVDIQFPEKSPNFSDK